MKRKHVPIAGTRVGIKDAANYVGVHPETLRRWESEGKIQPVRTPGGQRRYSVEDLESILNMPSTEASA